MVENITASTKPTTLFNFNNDQENNELIRNVCQYFVLVSSIIGNAFLLIVLTKLRGVKKLVDKFILNLVLFNLTLVMELYID